MRIQELSALEAPEIIEWLREDDNSLMAFLKSRIIKRDLYECAMHKLTSAHFRISDAKLPMLFYSNKLGLPDLYLASIAECFRARFAGRVGLVAVGVHEYEECLIEDLDAAQDFGLKILPVASWFNVADATTIPGVPLEDRLAFMAIMQKLNDYFIAQLIEMLAENPWDFVCWLSTPLVTLDSREGDFYECDILTIVADDDVLGSVARKLQEKKMLKRLNFAPLKIEEVPGYWLPEDIEDELDEYENFIAYAAKWIDL